MKKHIILDIECYKNYFLVSFMDSEKQTFKEFEYPLNKKSILSIMRKYTTVSFNGLAYDLPMLTAALCGWKPEKLKQLSDELILSGKAHWQICRENELAVPKWDHIDLIDVAPGKASLKIYGGRLHSKKLQDLPIEPSALIKDSQKEELRLYCRNDLITTNDLFKNLSKQINLRVSMGNVYNVDLRSKSDSQIAEAVLKSELEKQGVKVKKNTVKAGTKFKYKKPDFIHFKTDKLKSMLNDVLRADFVVKDSGQVSLPESLNKAIDYAGARYKFGIGGLHSQEKKQAIITKDDELLYEADFSSYYPFIILGEEFYPKHLGKGFLYVYSDIVNRRIKAKNSGDKVTADSLKITINGSFGKLGSKYSFLYSPDLLIQTTITGQLCLLMLIESVSAIGARVVSANTDGIVIHCKKSQYKDVSEKLFDFELMSGYNLEETFYKAIYSRDVNNYVAVKVDGETKGKGAFAEPNIMKNPQNEICTIAVKEYLSTGKLLADTICECKDVTKFLTVRSVTGGAVWQDDYLGKAVRFYYSKDGDSIHYKKNNNKVPKSDNSKPMMDLEQIPNDLNYDWYIDESVSMLKDLGADYA